MKKELHFRTSSMLSELILENDIRIDSDIIKEKADDIVVEFTKDAEGYTACLIAGDDEFMTIMQADNAGKSSDGIFASLLVGFEKFSFETFVQAALLYIELEEEGIVEFLEEALGMYDDYDEEDE